MKFVTKEVEQVEVSGLASLGGQSVLLMCMNYNYYGTLRGVNDQCVELEDAYIVYETGAWDANMLKDAQRLPAKEYYVQLASIESFCSVSK